MPEALNKLIAQLKEFWQKLDKAQKNRIYITSAIVAVIVTVSLVIIAKPNRSVLVSGEDSRSISEMAAILKDENIWYSIQNNTNLVVNQSDYDDAKVALGLKGYPKNGMTFEDAISMIGLSTTESDKEHIWEQQKIASLERTLMTLDNIDKAQVQLALPERSLFYNENDSNPTAMVTVKPSRRLSKSQVLGIVMIVSRSVEGLDPSYVTVVDNNLNILNEQYSDDLDKVANQAELRLQVANQMEQNFYKVFNYNNYEYFDDIKVVANPILDFDKLKKQTKELSNPEGMDSGAVIGSQTKTEKLEGSGAENAVGTDANPGTAPSYPTGESTSDKYSNKEETKNFEYNETLIEEEKASGYIKPEESTLAISLTYGQRVQDDSNLTEAFLGDLKVHASSITGIPVGNISVFKLKTAAIEEKEPTTSEKLREIFNQYGFFALVAMLILALIFATLPRKAESVETGLEPAVAGRAPLEETARVDELDLEEGSEIKKQIEKLVNKRPDAVAQLLRNWLQEDWNL